MKFFPDIRKFSWESTKSVKWNTQVQKSASGRVRTLTTQLLPAWSIECSFPGLTDDEARTMFGFVNEIKGSHEPFYWLDPEDYREEDIQVPSLGNNQYQAVMNIGAYIEPVAYIDNVKVFIDGAETTAFSYADGVITLNSTTNGTVTASYTYYWKVMLSDDGFAFKRIYKNINRASFRLEVVR